MVTASHISAAGGIGDVLSYSFTVDVANQITYLFLGSHEGQTDNIVSITVDGLAISATVAHSDGVTRMNAYKLVLSAGTHDLSVTTALGTFRYCFSFIKTLGWDSSDETATVFSGTGTAVSGSLETRVSDNVLSVVTADTNVTATSSDTLLSTSAAGTGASRMRMAISYDITGSMAWTLGSSQAWIMTLLRLRGTTLRISTPNNVGTPTHFSTPHVADPGRVILNP